MAVIHVNIYHFKLCIIFNVVKCSITYFLKCIPREEISKYNIILFG